MPIRRSSVLPMVGRRGHTQYVQAEPRGCSPQASELPVGSLTVDKNPLTNFVFERGVCNFDGFRIALFRLHRFEDAVIRQNEAARNVISRMLPGQGWRTIDRMGSSGTSSMILSMEEADLQLGLANLGGASLGAMPAGGGTTQTL